MSRTVAIGLGVLIAAVVAVPVVAYGIVPLFVKSSLVEDLPTASAIPASPAATAGTATATAAAASTLMTLVTGELLRVSAADYGTGTVRIVKVGADPFLRFENVDIAGAPDMYVYLSNGSDGRPGTFTDLGKLKATNGSFNYAIPASVDLAAVRSVVVWCRQFNVTVTYAVLR